jgi:lysozyme family protein
MSWTYEQSKKGYANLWAKAKLNPNTKATVLRIAQNLVTNQARYQQIASVIGCPWWFIAVAHQMESGANFKTYLGNGQSLAHVTTIEPIGRGPFKTFEAGALDALRHEGVDKIKVWDIPRALYMWESFNGFGYVSHGINSPYVWSYTNLYTRGKFVADHDYDPNAVSTQCGAAAILLALISLGAVKGNAMNDLQAALLPFEKLAPTLITALAGPAAGLAARVLAEALNVASVDDVKPQIDIKPIKDLKAILTAAESEIVEILGDTSVTVSPVRANTPIVEQISQIQSDGAKTVIADPAISGTVTVQPVQPEPTFLDRIIPAGWKTALGILVYCSGTVLSSLGYVTPDIGTAISTLGGGLAGVGMISKLDRWLPLFAGFLKLKK